jgi:hypothetical protein
VDQLLLKLILTPLLIAAASLAGHRWGPGVGGWLVGLPLTSGPIVLFLALREGPAFAATAAAGILAGTMSQAAFSVAYGRLAPARRWPACILAGSIGFGALTIVLEHVALGLAPLALVVAGTLVAALWLLPRSTEGSPDRPGATQAAASRPARPSWDLPARMIAATMVVLLLTGLATTLGARLTGLLSPFPVYGATLAAFGHRLEGPGAAIAVLRGLLLGLFGFIAFFWALAAWLEPIGLAGAFAAAIAVALVVQAASLWLVRRERPAAAP